VQRERLVPAALLALALFLACLMLLGPVARAWAVLLETWRGLLDIPGMVRLVRYDFYGLLEFDVPFMSFASGLPSSAQWWWGLLLTLALSFGSYAVPPVVLPLRYVLRLLAFFQAGAQIFFALWPRAFPYDGAGYVHGMLIAQLMLIALVPVVLGFTYYVLDFGVGRKALLTVLTMLHMLVLVPLQYAVHAYVVHHLSLLAMPLVFFVFGLTVNVLVFVSFYSWGVSWHHPMRLEDRAWARRRRDDGGNGNRNGGATRAAAATAVLLAALLAAWPAAAADVPPLTRSLEAGAAWGHHTNGYGDADGQFARFGLWREDRWAWRLEAGRSARFGDESLDGGLSYAHWFGKTSATLGISSGTGDYIAHRYRFDAAVSRPLAGVVTTLGYTRIQSKGENRSDGVGLGLARYLPHWVLSAQGRCDWGQPGDTRSLSGGVGVSYVVWRRMSIGVGYDAGDVSYLVVGPGETLVDYHGSGFNVGYQQWFGAHWGLNARLDYGETPFYNVRGASVSVFREW
jgi:YaiO family outer membrane protein